MMVLFRILFFSAILISKVAMATEEPNFKLIEKEGAYEIREYPSLLIAEVIVDGTMREASSKGFRLLADFIFGNNQSQTGGSEKIKMTAPVTTSASSEKIAMTAPVSVQKQTEGWRVAFTMPQHYSLRTLPKPNNPKVIIKEIANKRMAVLTFSGIATEDKTQQKMAELTNWVHQKQLKAMSLPELARYNPPWTLPFMRRNEVMIEVED